MQLDVLGIRNFYWRYTLRSARARQRLTFHFRTTQPEIDRWWTCLLNEIKIFQVEPELH
jgi:hypothetical protein